MKKMEEEPRVIDLKKNEIIDGISHKPTIDKANRTIGVVVECRNFVKLEYDLDTPEGQTLLGLNEMVGKRVIIGNVDGKLKIGAKSEREGGQ